MRSSRPGISWTRPCRSKLCTASHLATRKLLDHLLQLWVFLSDDLFELHRFHPRVLELREGTPGLDCLMLPPITYQQHAIIGMKAIHKLVHLLGGRERGFIEHIQAALSGVRLLPACKMLLQRGCFHACIGQLLRRAGRGREAFNLVPLRLCSFTDDGQRRCLARTGDAIQPYQFFAGEKHMLNGLALKNLRSFRVLPRELLSTLSLHTDRTVFVSHHFS